MNQLAIKKTGITNTATAVHKKNDQESFFGTTPQKEIPFIPPATVQAKLSVGGIGDQYEQEADAVANRVVNNLSKPHNDSSLRVGDTSSNQVGSLQQKTSAPAIQASGISSLPASNEIHNTGLENQLNASNAGGDSLPESLKHPMETSFGVDFSDVRLHTNSQAIRMNESLGARAFTVGQNIYFNQAQFQPTTKEGQKLIAHELTHTLQQQAGNKLIQRTILPSSDNAEIIRSGEVGIENLLLLFIARSELVFITDEYSFSRAWIEENRNVIQTELNDRLAIKEQQNRADHLGWYMQYLDTVSADALAPRVLEVQTMVSNHLQNAWFTDEQRALVIDRIVSRLDACARAYNHAALSIKLDLYREAQDQAALLNMFVEMLLPFAIPRLSRFTTSYLQTLPFRGGQFFNVRIFRIVERVTPHLAETVDSLGQFAKSRITNMGQAHFENEDQLVELIFNQFNNAIIAIQDRVREHDYSDIELASIYSNYDSIALNAVEYYRHQLQDILSEYREINRVGRPSSGAMAGGILPPPDMARIVYLRSGGHRRLAVITSITYLFQDPQYRFDTFISDDMVSLALLRTPHPGEMDADVVEGTPRF